MKRTIIAAAACFFLHFAIRKPYPFTPLERTWIHEARISGHRVMLNCEVIRGRYAEYCFLEAGGLYIADVLGADAKRAMQSARKVK